MTPLPLSTLLSLINHFSKSVYLFQDNLASMKRSILIFREGLVHRCDFGDDDELRQNLLHLVNHVLGFARDTIDNMNRQGSVDYGKVLRESFSAATGSSYLAGCVAESLLLATVNLHTSLKVVDATKKQNHTLNELGNQVTKLSIDALEYNVDKADKVLQIKNLGDVVPTREKLGHNTPLLELTSHLRVHSHWKGLTMFLLSTPTKDMSSLGSYLLASNTC